MRGRVREGAAAEDAILELALLLERLHALLHSAWER